MDRLLDDEALAGSSVVANCAMNRERQLVGVNSYARELGFSPLDRIRSRLPVAASVAWLDLCCGTGRALGQAAAQLHDEGLLERVSLVGVDLVEHFDPVPAGLPVSLVCAPIGTWTPSRSFDLITCVHGLHYVGDKLAALSRAVRWLTEDGLLAADLDLGAIRTPQGRPVRGLATALRRAGIGYDARRRRVTCVGPRQLELPYVYLGADDRAGPNYTGQPAVASYYRPS